MNEIDFNKFLQLIIKDKGGTPKQYNQLMDYIAYHETGPVHSSVPNQRMKTDAKQYIYDKEKDKYVPEGTGRGLFMFESHEDAGGNLAVNRTVNFLERNNQFVPQWLRELWTNKKSVDVSKLDADKQKMLFLGYHREHPTSNFSDVWKGKQSIQDFWLKNHWSGSANKTSEQIAAKLDVFNKNMAAKDSTEALKAKKEELELKKNMAPYLSNANKVENLPSSEDLIKNLFGAQDSSLIRR